MHNDETTDAPQPPRSVPGVGGPGSEETAPDGRRALRLHTGMSGVSAVLSAFVTVIFAVLLDQLVLAVVFAVLTVACIAWGAWTLRRLHLGGGRFRA